MSQKGVESLIRLKDFLPKLDEADLCVFSTAHIHPSFANNSTIGVGTYRSSNDITFLTGVPANIRTLRLGFNKLTSITSFGHLLFLERLDLSNNDIDSVQRKSCQSQIRSHLKISAAELGCLRHLRELKADNNRISSLVGLSLIDGLIKLSLKNNKLTTVDFGATLWSRMESLNLNGNALVEVKSVEGLVAVVSLDLSAQCPSFYRGFTGLTGRGQITIDYLDLAWHCLCQTYASCDCVRIR